MALKSAMNIVGTEHILVEQLSGLTSISQRPFNIVYPFCPLVFYAVNGHFRFHFLTIINSIPMAMNVQIFIQDFSLIFWGLYLKVWLSDHMAGLFLELPFSVYCTSVRPTNSARVI